MKFKTSFITKEKLPLVVEPTDPKITRSEFLKLLDDENAYFKKEMLKYGGILFRGFPLDNVDHFNDTIEHLNTGKCVDYIGGDSPRNKIKGNIYTSTEAPPSFKIPLHNELSFVKKYPSHIYFFCEIPSPVGGETIVGDTRKIYQDLDEDVKAKFIKNELTYVSRYHFKNAFMTKYVKGHKTWINVFETEDKKEVEKKCLDNEFGYKWNKNDWLQITQKRPAIINHPITNESVWFNQVHLYDFNPKLLGFWNYIGAKAFYSRRHTKLHDVYYGDESTISRKGIYHILDVLDKNTIYFKWQKGDVLALDNILAMHGRSTFSGKRRILTAMTR